jgi:hypothetical protein
MPFCYSACLLSPRVRAVAELLIVAAATSQAMCAVHPFAIPGQAGDLLDSRITVRDLLLAVVVPAIWFALAKTVGLYQKQAGALALEIVRILAATFG